MKTCVVARSYVAALEWALAQKLRPREWVYVDDAIKLLGLENPQIIFLEGWTHFKTPEQVEEIILRAQLAKRITTPEDAP